VPIRDNNSKITQKISLIHSYGSYVGLITTSTVTIEASTSTVLLGINATRGINEGVFLFKNLEVLGSIYINGWNVRSHPNLDLTAYYNITPFGSYTATTTTSTFTTTGVTNNLSYNNANYSIAADLVKMFSTSTYLLGSQVSVICVYNTATSVRKFELQSLYPPVVWWEPLNSYSYSYTATFTSTIGQVTWLWTSTTTATNIVL